MISREASAKLASVMSHEGTHAFGKRVEALAHQQGGVTYASILQEYGISGDTKTHFMTNTLFGYYDPDKDTNTRWWETDETSESVYRFATPKSSRIK